MSLACVKLTEKGRDWQKLKEDIECMKLAKQQIISMQKDWHFQYILKFKIVLLI